jgi:predicted metal-dependent enzyme (double-stranded beta helix superfamily)
MKEMKHDYVKHVKANDTERNYDVILIITQDLKTVHIIQGPKVITMDKDHKHWSMVSEQDFIWIKEDIQKDSPMLRNLLYVIKNH